MSEQGSSGSSSQSETFNEWVDRVRRKGNAPLIDEFNSIKKEKLAGTTTAFEQNALLNRYGNIPLLDQTRVILRDGLPNQYMHGSYVDGYESPRAYIICQAPVQTSIVDYWRMVWQERITMIVCLTSLKERGHAKADLFFPPATNRPFRAGPFRIIAQYVKPMPGHKRVMVAQFRLRCWCARRGTGERLVFMIYYGTWPDTAVPQDAAQFLKFLGAIKAFETWTSERAPPGGLPPVLVHCSAGVGRSATLVACRIGLDQLDAAGRVDVVGLVRRMRRQRAGAVQNVLQYIFINQLIAEAGRQRRAA